jgi:3-hydroxyisobutyrate dehydrogenase-like beta-hydroxyacid dehydrogenase
MGAAVNIGLIGLGMMGSRMATNLQNDSRSRVVLNRSRNEVAALNEPGPTIELAERNSSLRSPVLDSRRKFDTKSKSGL